MIPTEDQHPLPRDGTSQAARLPAALDPAAPRLDDRQLQDHLVLLRRLSARLQYWNTANQADGTWEPFLEGQVPVELAHLARRDAAAWRQSTSVLLARMVAGPEATTLAAGRELVGELGGAFATVDGLLLTFTRSTFLTTVERVVTQTLAPGLPDAIAAIKAVAGADAATWLEPLAAALTSGLWGVDPDLVLPDPDISAQPRDVQLTSLRRRLESLADAQFEGLAHLASEAGTFLNSTSLLTGDHPPHLALWLAALELFRHGQDALNDLLRRHLEFYDRALLQIQTHAAKVDRLFVTFEPARTTVSTLLPAETRLLAGKDDAGAERHFVLDRDVVVNQATVAELRSTFVDPASQGQWRAAWVANSADGLGAALPKASPSWQPFGHAGLPVARRGFAVAGPVLRLSGGDKTLTLRLQLGAASGVALASRCLDASSRGGAEMSASEWPLEALFAVSLTGAEGWIPVDASRFTARFAPASRVITLVIGPIGPELAVVPYTSGIHGRAFDTHEPLLELLLSEASPAYPGDFLEGLSLEGTSLECDVEDDARLVIATDVGTVDPTKPFQPFGPIPVASSDTTLGSSFFVGSAEILGKHLTRFELTPTWKEVPTGSLGSFEVQPAYLFETRWQQLGTTDLFLFDPVLTVSPTALEEYAAQPGLPVVQAPTSGLDRGFIRFVLSAPSTAFGHASYVAQYTQAIVTAVRNDTNPVLPATPVSPVLSSLVASYSADQARDFAVATAADLEFHHVEPHGEWPLTQPDAKLIPGSTAHGEFFLGITNATPESQLSLLLHLAEGSGDPFAVYPAVSWEYLAGDTWRPFESEDFVADGTNQLRRSGIVLFSLPSDLSVLHHRMPAGVAWLRAVALGDPLTGDLDALNRAYVVTAQAADATFLDQGNDLSRLGVPLPAGSVTRFVHANPAIKKVIQPLPSLGGAQAEAGTSYYRRVSERLRHRQRGVALWDYERLVLEAFPSLHKVKCIPHSSPDSALAPGHVLVVLIPQLSADSFDPQRPAASQDLLAEVTDFLVPLLSAHVQLHVVNPLYDEVQVIAHLAFRAGYDQGFHLTRAATDLTQFLAPWAYGEPEDLAFGRDLYPSAILNYLEERDYVDYVSEFRVRQFIAGVALSPDPMVLSPSTERSILVSHRLHDLSIA